jgi:hypothetical protein
MGKSDDARRKQSERLADSIKEQERRREELKFQEEWNKRIVIAREGRVAYEGSDTAGAVANYKKILSLTARRYNVSIDNLNPKLFDAKMRTSEALLISAICLDLAKVMDRLEGPSAKKELKMYLRLFVAFSKSMPFEVVATSTIRKYMLYTHGLKNKDAFNTAYNSLRRGVCFVATAAFESEEASELDFLRDYRDLVLMKSLLGRKFISIYYRIGPIVAQVVSKSETLRYASRSIIRVIIRLLPKQLN